MGWERRQVGTTTTKRGYGYAWQVIRARIIRRDKGLCQLCLETNIINPFHAVDHKVSKGEGGTDDDDNLQCICKMHHKLKTQSEAMKGKVGAGKN